MIVLQSLLQRCGAIVAVAEHCRDDATALEKTFQSAAKNEIMIVTGGVSVGEYDLVQATLRKLGAKIDIWRVALKPGKPFLFGKLGSCFVFGLPGNPVSAFVTFLQFVRPAILKMMSANDVDLPKLPARLSGDLKNESERAHYVRGKFQNGSFAAIGRQESHALFGLSESNALLRVGSGASLKAGETVSVQIF
jgi:molybdopterin molybdotransferase